MSKKHLLYKNEIAFFKQKGYTLAVEPDMTMFLKDIWRHQHKFYHYNYPHPLHYPPLHLPLQDRMINIHLTIVIKFF